MEPELPKDLMSHGSNTHPQNVLDRRSVHRDREEIQQVLIQWGNGGSHSTTWEDEKNIHEQFPEFNLGDKVLLREESNVRNKVWNVYSRKNKRNYC